MRLLFVLMLTACTVSGFDKSRRIEYSCERNGELLLEWEDDDRQVELRK
jgi:hypothetical protein